MYNFFKFLKFIRIINLELIRTFSKVENKLQKNTKKMNLMEEKFNGKVGILKNLYLKKFHLCKLCNEVFVENHKQLENHLEKIHNIDEENFDQIFGDIKEICCQTNSNETQIGKRKVLLKNFHLCNFCKQVFAKNHQQLKVHMKKFHKIDFAIKSNELIEEIVSKKKKLKVLIRKLDDSLINEILSKKE